MLTDAQIHACRETLNDSFPDTCEIQHVTLSSDGAGGQTETITTEGPSDCRLVPLGIGSAGERDTADRTIDVSLWVLTVPWDTPLSVLDRVVCGGDTFEVREVNAQRSVLVCIRAFLVRIR